MLKRSFQQRKIDFKFKIESGTERACDSSEPSCIRRNEDIELPTKCLPILRRRRARYR